jgi:hypothetical protein
MESSELYDALVRLCQQYGTTTESTYNHLHEAIASIAVETDDTDWLDNSVIPL